MMSTSAAQYHLVSADSDSCDSTGTRLKTLKPIGKMKKQKHRSRIADADNCNWNRLGVSVGIFFSSFLLVWIIVLTLLTTELFKRTVDLQRGVASLSAQTGDLPVEIHKCRTFSEHMKKNQTQLAVRVSVASQKITNMSSLIIKAEKSVSVMEEKLKSLVGLSSIPGQLLSLTSSVAGLESEVQDLKTAIARFRDLDDKRNLDFERIKANISSLNETFRANFAKTRPANDALAANEIRAYVGLELAKLNGTITKRLRYQTQDQEEDHKLIQNLQESVANLSSQIMSLNDNFRSCRQNYNHLELEILTVKEQLRAKVTTPAVENVGALTTKPINFPTAGMSIGTTIINDRAAFIERNSSLNLATPPVSKNADKTTASNLNATFA